MTEVNQPMMVIRKRLSADEIGNPRLRINPTTGEVESTPDGGTTWNPAPGEDPRHSDAFRLPALVGDHRCDVAARITAELQEALAVFITDASAALIVTNVLALLLLLTGPIGWAVDFIFAVGTAIASIGVAAITAAFTSEVWEGIQCIIYNNIDENGQMSQAQADAIYAEIFANYSGTISGTYAQLNSLFGEVLFSNAGVERTETGDCDDCDSTWRYRWDFRLNDGGFTFDSEAGITGGVWRGDATHGYGKTATGSACGGLAMHYDCGRKSANFNIPADCVITEMISSHDASGGIDCSHLEMYVAANRTAGLNASRMHSYMSSWGLSNTETTNPISGPETGVHCTFQFAGDATLDFYYCELAGTGTMPNFSGGAEV